MVWILASQAGGSQLDFFALRDISEYRNLAHYPIGIDVGCRHYLVDSAIWKLAFPVPDFSVVDNFRYFTVLSARSVNSFQMFVTGSAGAFSKIMHHVGIHKSYPVIRAGDDDAICHPIYDFEQLVSFAGDYSLQPPGFFRLVSYYADKATNNTGEYGKNYHPE
jgi:hypothetical protein